MGTCYPVASIPVPAGVAPPVLPVLLPTSTTGAMVASAAMLVGAILLLLSVFCYRDGSKKAALDAVNSVTKLSMKEGHIQLFSFLQVIAYHTNY